MHSTPTGNTHNMTDVEGKPANSVASASALPLALSFWKEFDLDSRRPILDSQGLEIADNQQSSIKSRKALASATKAFRKEEDRTKVKLLPQLLRQYQEEIDRLTKRARFAETSYMNLYQSLSEAPDPSKALQVAASTSRPNDHHLSAKVKRLEAEIREYETEFANLTNQDITIRQLEEKIEKLEEETEKKIEEAVLKRENELKSEQQQANEVYAEEDSSLASHIDELKAQLSESQSLYEEAQDQLMTLRESLDEKDNLLMLYQNSGDIAGVHENIGMTSIETGGDEAGIAEYQKRIEDLDTECQRLRVQLNEERKNMDTTVQQQTNREQTRILELRDEVHRKQERIEQMIKEKTQLEEDHESSQKEFSKQVAELKIQVSQASARAEELTAECNSRPTLEEFNKIQGELLMLRVVEFNVSPDEDAPSAENPLTSETKDSKSDMSAAEKILFGRVRKLESTASVLRVQLEERDNALAEAMTKLRDVSGQLALKEEQYTELEKENLQLERLRLSQDKETVLAGNQTSSASSVVAKTDDSSLLLQQVLGDSFGAEVGFGSQNSDSMTHILHGQRDRFRQRMQELEAEKDALANEVSRLLQAESRLREDNVKLYEKIRYLESYGTTYGKSAIKRGNFGSKSGHAQRVQAVNIISDDTGDVETRYKTAYEEQMNPFNDFSQRERRKRYKGLNALEKVTLNISQLVFTNKYMRSFVFTYACLLHLMVFFAMWFVTHNNYRKCSHFGNSMQDRT